MKKIAIVCFNLGGPDSTQSVKPFLFNLFNDKAIIGLPQPFRFLLAKLISGRREKTAQEIYEHLGGKSPLLELTYNQANALETSLNQEDYGQGPREYKTFVAMRYWHPFAEKTVKEVKQWQADHVVLLPLYPQFSTTTSGSSIKQWQEEATKQELKIPTQTVGCYFAEKEFIGSHVATIKESIFKVKNGSYRLLFSAHGLPEKIVNGGDPYQWQVEQTAKAVMGQLTAELGTQPDHVVCYQSRVGPLKWIGPSTEDEIKRAGEDKTTIMLIPIAFVSEHSETLVELDIEYKEFADEHGVEEYIRVPALGTQELFIKSLKNMVKMAEGSSGPISHMGGRICPQKFGKCICIGEFKQ